MKEQNLNNNRKDYRNIIYSVVGVMVLVAIVAGATFAYYAFTVSNNVTINGTAASASGLGVTVTKLAGETELVPQLDSSIADAVVGTTTSGVQNRCKDANGNTVCQIYQINLSNTGSTGFAYKLSVSFTNGTNSLFTNLKWATLTEASTSATSSTGVSTGTATLASAGGEIKTGTLAATTGTDKAYIVVWLSETNSEQASTDYGTFTGTVTLTDSAGNSYLTSTFTA